jgi:hypothetical protein
MTLRRRPTLEEIGVALERARQDPNSDWYVPAGATVLQTVHDFLGRFVVYPSKEAHVAHTLWIVHTFFMDHWDSTPRIAFLSPEPGSGKSRALEVTEPLVDRAVHAVNTTPAYLFRKVSDPDGLPVILYDEIDTVFGPKAKDNEDVRGMLNAGHRHGALAGRCVTKGNKIVTEDLPAYCAVALAGLNDLPDTISTRSVIVRMRKRIPDEKVEPWRNRIHKPQGEEIRAQLQRWAESITGEIEWPEMPEAVEDRNADIWESLLAVAVLAGGEWPERARVSAVSLVSDSRETVPSMNIRLLMDLRDVFGSEDRMFSSDLLRALIKVDDAPWGDMNGLGRELTPRGLAQRLGTYGIKPKQIRNGLISQKGYLREDLKDAWIRYLGVAGASDQNYQSQTINTEDVVKKKGATGRDGEPLSTTSWKPETSETEGKFDTCRTDGCTAGLYHPESQQLGYCAKCRKDDAA